MKVWRSVLVLIGLTALCAGSFGQGAGPGAKQQGDGPRAQQGQRGRFMQALEKLKLTDKQKQQIEKARADWMKGMQAARQEQDREKRRAKMRELGQAFRAQLDKILTPEQKKKFDTELQKMRSNRQGAPGGPAGAGPNNQRSAAGGQKGAAGKTGSNQKQK